MTGFHKTLLALLGPALLVLASCLPKPEEPIEWLRREDAVIVQRKGIAAVHSEFGIRSTVPDFTLYGDGTVISRRFTTEGATLHVGRLEAAPTGDLLDLIEDQGFFDFAYEQAPEAPTTETTTYIYVHTKLAANSVAAVDVESEGPAPKQFRRVQEISQRLSEIAQKVAEGGDQPFDPGAVVLLVRPLGAAGGATGDWPYAIDLVELVGRQATPAVVSGVLEREAARELLQPSNSVGRCWFRVEQEGRLFDVCVRPVLPFEEHFPEFDQPQ